MLTKKGIKNPGRLSGVSGENLKRGSWSTSSEGSYSPKLGSFIPTLRLPVLGK